MYESITNRARGDNKILNIMNNKCTNNYLHSNCNWLIKPQMIFTILWTFDNNLVTVELKQSTENVSSFLGSKSIVLQVNILWCCLVSLWGTINIWGCNVHEIVLIIQHPIIHNLATASAWTKHSSLSDTFWVKAIYKCLKEQIHRL